MPKVTIREDLEKKKLGVLLWFTCFVFSAYLSTMLKPRIGYVGTGFIVREVMSVVRRTLDVFTSKVLTRRAFDTVQGFDRESLTHSIDELIDSSDVVFEATGDPIHASIVVEKALAVGRPVLTMNSELHVTTGSFFHGLGFLSEALGDQPGTLAALQREAVAMGFEPLAYVNIKGFLNLDPAPEEMEYWSKRQKLSLPEVISFTDGTKLQIEQALVANGLGADIAEEGLIGGRLTDLFETDYLARAARASGGPISDYVVAPGAPPGVFVLADHDAHERLPYYGPYQKLRTREDGAYLLLRAYHLCGLEVARSLSALLRGDREPLLSNGADPRISVAAVAKRPLAADTVLERGIGSYRVRGSCVRTADRPRHVPIGLLAGARLRRRVEAGAVLDFDDVELPESRALEMWLTARDRYLRPVKTLSA